MQVCVPSLQGCALGNEVDSAALLLTLTQPACVPSEKHLPGFVALSDELKAAGAEVIACVSGV